MLASTIYDLVMRHKNGNKFRHQFLIWKLLLFDPSCASSTARGLFRSHQRSKSVVGENDIRCVNGVKVMSLLWVMLGHRFLLQFSLPVMNQTDFLQVIKHSPSHQIYKSFFQWNSTFFASFVNISQIGVDAFLLVGGLLVANSVATRMNSKKTFNFLSMIFHRFFRIIPVFGFLILLLTSILKYLGNGPYFKNLLSTHKSACEEYWWSALLSTQNVVNPREMVS